MRFGDRISASSVRLLKKRNLTYFQHLAECGFNSKDAIYKYFGADVFHDSAINVEPPSTKWGILTLTLKNVYALDKVTEAVLRPTGIKATIDESDFQTTIRCLGVTLFKIRLRPNIVLPTYHSAEIGRKGPGVYVEIALSNGAPACGVLRIECHHVEVDDISKRLVKYLGSLRRARQCLTHLIKKPVDVINEQLS